MGGESAFPWFLKGEKVAHGGAALRDRHETGTGENVVPKEAGIDRRGKKNSARGGRKGGGNSSLGGKKGGSAAKREDSLQI